MRILDALVGDDEQLEEIYLEVSFSRQDYVFRIYRETCRLAELEARGWITSRLTRGYTGEYGPAGRSYELTDQGRAVRKRKVADPPSMYELAG